MNLKDELLQKLGSDGLQQIAGTLGTDEETARRTVEAVAGTIVGGMASNAERPEGADALRSALDDHVASDPFNSDMSAVTRDGSGILGHVLGEQGTEQAASGISQFAGVNTDMVKKLLPLIAPMIMALLAGRASNREMDAGAVAQDLNNEKSEMSGGGLGDLLGAVLGGGSLGGLLGGLLGGGGRQTAQSAEPEQRPAPDQPAGGNNPDW